MMLLHSLPSNKLHGTCVENDCDLTELKLLRPVVFLYGFLSNQAAQLEKLDKFTK